MGDVRRPVGRPRLESWGRGEFLREVAEVFEAAHAEGKPPVVAVREHFGCPMRTAQNRIKRARDLGFLRVPRRASGRRGSA